MPAFIMMIGLPASGKSTAREQIKEKYPDTVDISTDDIIEEVAQSLNTTYDKVFSSVFPLAESKMKIELVNAITANKNIIWDQTNLTAKTRAKKLAQIPSYYAKIGFVLPKPEDIEWNRRLNERTGKTIPPHILKSMETTFSVPEFSEGFDYIVENIEELTEILK